MVEILRSGKRTRPMQGSHSIAESTICPLVSARFTAYRHAADRAYRRVRMAASE